VTLDQIHLQNERFQLRTDDDPFDIDDLLYEPPCFAIMPCAGMEIGAHAVLEIDRLANINDFPLGVFHDIATRLIRECGEGVFDVFRDLHKDYFTLA